MISIITPVYNGEKFIEPCIKNVIDQKCSDMEHIIVDGGSTDRTVEIIKQYAERYPHIRWISKKDKGQSDAMNKGITMAQGEVLGILNVDDFYELDVLNRVVEIFRTLPEPSLLVGNCNLWDDEAKITHVNKPANLNFFDLLTGLEHKNPFPYNPSAYFYHTSLHQKIGTYTVDDHYQMDLDFILRAVQVATVKYVDELWGNYRLIKGTKTFNHSLNGQSEDRFLQLLRQYRKKLPFFQQVQILIIKNLQSLKYFLRKLKSFSSVGRPESTEEYKSV